MNIVSHWLVNFLKITFLKIKSQFYTIVETEEKNICLDKLVLQLIIEKNS